MPTRPSKNLETFPNPHPDRDYIIEIEAPEFTCLCPKTGQPDFATLSLEYVPDRLCVELKSLKLYIWSYRDEGHFHEDASNRILNDLVAAVQPRFLRLRARFYVRGGIYTTVTVEHRRPGWSPPPPAPGPLPRESQPLPGRDEPGAAAAPAEAPASPPAQTARGDGVFLGIDFGTTGCRVVAIDGKGAPLAQAEAPIPAPLRVGAQVTQDPEQWWQALVTAVQRLLPQIRAADVRALAVDGTSTTLMLCDGHGRPIGPALLYHDSRAVEQAERIAEAAPSQTAVHGPSSGLAKLLWLQDRKLDARASHALHQADWVCGRLTGVFGTSDYHNALKLGFDTERLAWPDWLVPLGVNTALLPRVHNPGETIGRLSPETAAALGLPPEVEVAAGTTDGVAAFLATGACAPGHGMTSLGSTIVLKLLCAKPIYSAGHGVYSHRLGHYWLTGGASNSGGAALARYFTSEEMQAMTPRLDPDRPTGLNYYPLPDVGERFPIHNPHMKPKLDPLPGDSVTFFQGMLEGMARIEAQGYELLEKLGAPRLTELWTTGGGARNAAWEKIRARLLKVTMHKPLLESAAYGAARLASGQAMVAFTGAEKQKAARRAAW